jgi:hypothetical protein
MHHGDRRCLAGFRCLNVGTLMAMRAKKKAVRAGISLGGDSNYDAPRKKAPLAGFSLRGDADFDAPKKRPARGSAVVLAGDPDFPVPPKPKGAAPKPASKKKTAAKKKALKRSKSKRAKKKV